MAEGLGQGGNRTAKVIAFEHRLFRTMEGGHFRISDQSREAVFAFNYGELQATLPFRGIRREFGIAEDSPDGRMLDLVEQGLTFVRFLKPGDPLPPEILTGEASWEVQPHHRETAFHRITLQLVSWFSGSEVNLTDTEAIRRFAEDPETKRKINDAFGEAAERLGLGRDRREEVTQHIENLAEELAYVEALRERFKGVIMMQQKIQTLRRMFGQERSVLEIADPVARLIETAVKMFADLLADVDAQTGEILSVLRNIQRQVDYIRGIRDDLYRRLMAWDEMFADWYPARVERSEGNVQLLRKTYRFLAPRFMQVDEWTLMSQLGPAAGAGNKRFKSEMRWF